MKVEEGVRDVKLEGGGSVHRDVAANVACVVKVKVEAGEGDVAVKGGEGVGGEGRHRSGKP